VSRRSSARDYSETMAGPISIAVERKWLFAVVVAMSEDSARRSSADYSDEIASCLTVDLIVACLIAVVDCHWK